MRREIAKTRPPRPAACTVDRSSPEYLRRFVVWRNGCVENVPRMTVTSVKLIGRCVILHVRGCRDGTRPPYYYTGLVTLVTKFAVSMMHVNRYTEADFRLYRERERQSLVAQGLPVNARLYEPFGCPRVDAGGRSESGGNGDAGADALFFQGSDGVVDIDSARGLASAFPSSHLAKVHADGQRSARAGHDSSAATPLVGAGTDCLPRSSRAETLKNDSSLSSVSDLCRHGLSAGPLPYVTINRSSIASAFLGRDPRSSFYSLFQDPSRELLDMQYLRMFVRQYLVHISEGNKARRVDLYSFVMVRGACPMVETELLKRIAFEELPVLLNADHHHLKTVKVAAARAQSASGSDDSDIEFIEVTSAVESDTAVAAAPSNAAPRRKKKTCCGCFGLFTLEYRRQES